MNSEAILKSDILEILFEKRNKAYGAYILRKFYPHRLLKSLVLMMSVVIVLTALTFFRGEQKIEIPFIEMGLGRVIVPAAPEKKKEVPITKKSEAPHKKTDGIPVITKNEVTDSIKDNKPTEKTGVVEMNTTAQGGPDVTVPGSSEKAAPFAEEKLIAPPIDVTSPIANPEVMPEYPGGLNALRKFLERNLHNPRDLNEGEKISVSIKFVVGYDGKLKSFELVENGGEEFNNEVIRVLKRMPEWIPGKSKGQNVSVYYTIPVKFIPGE